ncbi:MAG: TIGR01212 family radical SAM protein [Thermodesulfovibrio sp.]|nr:TIGR01212 family radical SAM protein [Thermodesulfovibrio sp.]
MQRYNSFGPFMRKKFGQTVYKVNVDAGFTCPNRDGTLGVTGCIYCNNDSFRPNSCKPSLSISEQVQAGIGHVKKRYKADKFLVYFQAYTNTYAPLAELEKMYSEALSHPDVLGLAIGTRPDAVDEEKIAMLQDLASRYYILIEYGLQSIYDRSLEYINRGHNYQAFLDAVEMTKNRNIAIGAHLIVGFPTETREEMLAMADTISRLPVQFLKVHQLQIVRETPLAGMYQEKPFHVFEYEEYLDFVVDFIERTSPEIVFQRLYATAPDAILIAPEWGRNRHRILQDIEKRLVLRQTHQGSKFALAATG